MLQVIPSFQTNDTKKTATFFLQTNMKTILRVKYTVLLATMTKCASYPIADITLY